MARASYPSSYYDGLGEAERSAEIILPIVFGISRPRSVVDLGCGNGAFLSVARRLGAEEVVGLDGPWVREDQLQIPLASFRRTNFEEDLPSLNRRFDLAITVEVLEHVSRSRADHAVAWLCAHASLILFSAAIPGQGGKHHINEEWLTGWAARFARHGYQPYDIVRPRIWSDDRVATWYRQNVVVMAETGLATTLGLHPADPEFLDLVHPRVWERKSDLHRRLYGRSIEGRARALKRFLLRQPRPY